MKIRRYVAKDMRTALAQIKQELGVDAVIMSNKKTAEGVELMAAVDYNQPTASSIEVNQPKLQPETVKQGVSEDVVSLSQPNNYNAAMNTVPKSMSDTAAKQNEETVLPSDSLSALLNRKIQQPEMTQQSIRQPIQQSSAVQSTIEQEFKKFTDRLAQSSEVTSEPLKETQEATFQDDITENNAALTDFDHHATEINHNKLNNKAKDSVANTSEMESMKKEMASIRQLLEHQVSGLMWQDMAQKDPSRAVLVNRLTSMGLAEHVADQVAGYVPAGLNEQDAWSQAKKLISQQLNTTNNDIIQRGGIVSLVGPTGVGKTTTIAKLAARFAQVHGADQVALISTDTYKIAGFEQLSTYGKIIGCQVKLAKDAASLDAILQDFAKKKLILIDTAGMGQRDMRLAQHLTGLISNTRIRIRNYLVLSANTQLRVMQENVERFKKVPLAGCIYTKLDESLSVGEIISTSIQNGLPIGYLTDGQRVPEDIKVANTEKLVTLADRMAAKTVKTNTIAWRIAPVSA
jgi:flagellar biosynthesis protein FlhF